MFYTRPKIPLLSLDLVQLDGGGSCPSQFSGTTIDGRPLYIRYRNGWLSANLGAIGDQPGPEGEELVAQQIGPPFHGDILLEQVCDLLGLTLLGTMPPFTEEDRISAAEQGWILDWSGRTTYWEEQLQVTKTGGEHFIRALRAAFDELCILEIEWRGSKRTYIERSSIAECKYRATLGLNPNQKHLDTLLHSKDAKISDCKAAFSQMFDFQFSWNGRSDKDISANYKEFHEKFFRAFGAEAALSERNHGAISGEFGTDQAEAAKFMTTLYGVIEACFGRHAAWVEPQGAVLKMMDKHTLHSRDLAEWCRQSSYNFISWTEQDFGSGKTVVGLRAL